MLSILLWLPHCLELVYVAEIQVELFMVVHQGQDWDTWSPERVQDMVQAINRAFDALHQARQGRQDVRFHMNKLAQAMYPLARFEARLQAHGAHLAIPGGPMQALVQLAQPLLFPNPDNVGAAEALQVQNGGEADEKQ